MKKILCKLGILHNIEAFKIASEVKHVARSTPHDSFAGKHVFAVKRVALARSASDQSEYVSA